MPTTVDDDQLFMVIIVQSASNTINSGPSGWTLVDTRQNGNLRSYLYRKIASSEPASYSIGLTGSSFVMATVEAFNVDSFAEPFTAWQPATDSNATRIDSVAVATTGPGGGFVHYLLVRDGSGTSTWGTPSGYTENDDNGWSQSRIMTYSKAEANAGSSGVVTFIEPLEDFAYDDVTLYSIAVDAAFPLANWSGGIGIHAANLGVS